MQQLMYHVSSASMSSSDLFHPQNNSTVITFWQPLPHTVYNVGTTQPLPHTVYNVGTTQPATHLSYSVCPVCNLKESACEVVVSIDSPHHGRSSAEFGVYSTLLHVNPVYDRHNSQHSSPEVTSLLTKSL